MLLLLVQALPDAPTHEAMVILQVLTLLLTLHDKHPSMNLKYEAPQLMRKYSFSQAQDILYFKSIAAIISMMAYRPEQRQMKLEQHVLGSAGPSEEARP